MVEKRFKIKLLTPLFNFGTEKETEELRAQSLKGLMRFWWRTVSGIVDKNKLLEKENEIFGSSEKGKSKVMIQINEIRKQIRSDNFPYHSVMVKSKRKNINILDYLAYGPSSYSREKRGMILSRYIAPEESVFELIIKSFEEESFKEGLKAFYLLSKFGNIGAKSRNGFGGFEILEGYFDDYNFLRDILNSLNHSLMPYTSFSKETKVFKTKGSFKSWDEALAEIGKAYRKARLSLENRHQYYKRQYISAPIMVGNRNKAFLERHSKSMFFKVKKENNSFYGYVIFMPYDYLNSHPKRNNNNLNRYLKAYNLLFNKRAWANTFEEVEIKKCIK